MDTLGFNELLAEIDASRPAYLDRIEGLNHQLEQKDLLPITVLTVRALLEDYQRRDGFLVRLHAQTLQARNTVIDTVNDGYPTLPARTIDKAEYDDLGQNKMTIDAAFGQFAPRVITTEGTSTVGPEEPIP